ncbi:pantoate--beta-alanine ligase [Mobilicoccus pelagius]|uniref:Pantothenate synthetase n=1 Tax=Mobilicoccus pelagius NBRC 104925 TaxID=1089455 RepID=H5US67_9MICO|nr:pantoate--beta-alanine ligase [Mobilicoccus pelagius]GAB48575.1 pantothenate synthetase [Mobilicoccus pelagius NBRC 104925]
MKVVTTRAEVREERARLGRLGFVPTMGYLHDGHLSLVRRAKEECGHVAVSIFVNPTQFGPGEDLASYPRDPERDLALLEEAGVDLVWLPQPGDVYPSGFATTVEVDGVTDVLEGASRPGHFAGVATVVSVLLGVVRPDVLFVGQKDLQQSVVLRRLAADLALVDEVVVCPTGREADGLARSSRNAYLDAEDRQAATVLSRALRAGRAAYDAGERDAETLRRTIREVVEGDPRAEIDYVSLADPETLVELDGPVDKAAASLAVRIGRPRLLDNTLLHEADPGLG